MQFGLDMFEWGENDNQPKPFSAPSRRRVLKLVATASVVPFLPGQLLRAEEAVNACAPPIPANHSPSNGGSCPYPIPWLDKNGSHNQPAGPRLEPSHIYHFKGQVGRCADFVGMGTDNKGNRIAFGTPTTDYGFMEGEYFAGRTAQTGAFTHI